MNQLILAICLLSANGHVPSGSLLVLENSNKPVTAYTRSSITHVAVILQRPDGAWVYEATPAKVRRLALAEYYAEIAQLDASRDATSRVWLLEPDRPYSEAELQDVQRFVDSQIGRRYSVRGYVRGKQGDGVHCAEFATATLARTNRFDFDDQHYAVSPDEFYRRVKDQHAQPTRIALPDPPREPSWCARQREWWQGFRYWCAWACYETWTFCR